MEGVFKVGPINVFAGFNGGNQKLSVVNGATFVEIDEADGSGGSVLIVIIEFAENAFQLVFSDDSIIIFIKSLKNPSHLVFFSRLEQMRHDICVD